MLAGDASAPPSPPAAAAIFGARLPIATEYVAVLASSGVDRGLIGPREVPRLWDRHLLNCAVIGELIPAGAELIDVGSGAGLPGIALALARPDLRITLLEPAERRNAFLGDVVSRLELTGVVVVRGRAEEGRRQPVEIVTARAVAPLVRLVPWCLPLVLPGGRLLAVKGAGATAEIEAAATVVKAAGGRPATVRLCGRGIVDPPTTVVEVAHAAAPVGRKGKM